MDRIPKKRKSLTVSTKLKIISEIENGKSQPLVAKENDLSVKTVGTIWLNREKIKKDSTTFNLSFKKVRKCGYDTIDEDLFQWFNNQRARNLSISGPILKGYALKIAEEKGLEDFAASDGWLESWKKRHGVVFKTVAGESASVNMDAVDNWLRDVWPSISAGYEPRDIYNTDETGLFYRLMPSKTYDFKGSECHGGKQSKERLTVLLCANADGTDKMKPLVIGKSARPRCFKNIRDYGTLPVRYENNKTAWMTSAIFGNWIKDMDRSMKLQNRKIILLMDNCPSHVAGAVKTDNVKLVFLPPNTTSIAQPLDRGIINSFKVHYRRDLINKTILKLDAGNATNIDVLEAIYGIQSAWRLVTSDCIANCFVNAKIIPRQFDADIVKVSQPEDNMAASLQALDAEGVNFNDYVTVDENLILHQDLEPCNNALEEPNLQDQEGSDDESEETRKNIKPGEALKLVQDLKYFLCCVGSSPNVIASADDIERSIIKTKMEAMKQSVITNFLSNKTKMLM